MIAWMTFSPDLKGLPPTLRSPFHSFLIPALGACAIILVGFLVTAFTRPQRADA